MNRAERALSLLRDEFFVDEINALKKSYVDTILNSHPDDMIGREDAYRMHHAIEALMAHFESIADDKKVQESKWKIF